MHVALCLEYTENYIIPDAIIYMNVCLLLLDEIKQTTTACASVCPLVGSPKLQRIEHSLGFFY